MTGLKDHAIPEHTDVHFDAVMDFLLKHECLECGGSYPVRKDDRVVWNSDLQALTVRHPGRDFGASDFAPGVHVPATLERVNELLESGLIKEHVRG